MSTITPQRPRLVLLASVVLGASCSEPSHGSLEPSNSFIGTPSITVPDANTAGPGPVDAAEVGASELDAQVTADAGSRARSDAASSVVDDGSSQAQDSGRSVPTQPGYLHTDGGKIVDHDGHEVRLTGINWFGMETSNYAPHGLWTRSLESMLDQITSLGYNMLRLPFCSQLFDPGSSPNGIDTNQNPSLAGLSGLALMDAVVEAAGKRGLRVVLDRHRPDSGAQSELWYTAQYSEQRWIADWQMLAAHYLGNPTVIGFDLHNEPHGSATWGDGNMSTDWRAAAERAGNAVLEVNPDLLIIVEGVEKLGNDSNWWGGNLRYAKQYPVRLSIADRLVYSAHEYPPSVYMQPWFSASDYPSNLPGVWHDNWGYLIDENSAPVWLGEFGTKLQTVADKQWLNALASYIQQRSMNFAYWCWNPDSGDTGGILQDDWTTVNTDKQAVIAPLLAPNIR